MNYNDWGVICMRPTALITGASDGIGYELAKWFAKAGYRLIITARSEDKLTTLKQELGSLPVTVIVQDLSYPGAATALYHRVKEQNQTVDVLVNNAGFGLSGNFAESNFEEQQKMVHLNVNNLTDLTHLFLADIKKAPLIEQVPKGILNVASLAAFLPGPGMAAYHASKAYVLNFSESLREELSGTGLRVTTLCPGPTATNFFKTAKAESSVITKNSLSAEVVARAGFLGFIKGQRLVLPGALTQMNAVTAKFVPRVIAAKATKHFYAKE